MDLTPEYIEANLEKFGQNEARDIIKQWIVNSNDEDLRIRALNLLLLIVFSIIYLTMLSQTNQDSIYKKYYFENSVAI